MKKSLCWTLGIGILATVAVFAGGLFLGLHWVRVRAASLEDAARTTLDTTVRGLDNVFIQAQLAARFAADDLSLRPRPPVPEEMPTLTRIFYEAAAETCPAVSHIYIGFAPGMLTTGQVHNAFLIRRLDDQGKRTDFVKWSDASGEDYFTQGWYLVPSSLGRATWTLSHTSRMIEGRRVISYVVPFFRQIGKRRRLVGVTGVAIDIAKLDDLIVPFHPVSFAKRLTRAKTLVVNPWGTNIIAPDSREKVGLSLFDAAAIRPVSGDRDAIRRLLQTGPESGTVNLASTAVLGGAPAATELYYHRLCNGWVAVIAVPASWRMSLIAPAAVLGGLVLVLFAGLVALAFLAERRRLAMERAAAEGELNAARAIQHDLLPAVLPPLDGFTNVTVAASLDAAKGVGGDLYDVVPVDASHVAFIIGDVSGKGVPASLFMAIVQTLQRSLLHAVGPDPAPAANALNRLLSANNRSNMFVTYWIGILDVTTGEIAFTNGGHNPPLIHRTSGAVEFLRDRHGPPLGILPKAKPYRSARARLAEGDSLILYTDGVTEASDRRLRMFTEERLEATLAGRPAEPPAATLAAIKAAVARFVAGAEPFDDLTVLVARYGATGAEKRFETEAVTANAPAVHEFLSSLPAVKGLDERRRNRLLVAAEELFVNVCKYAYGGKAGPFALTASVQNARLALTFSDRGTAFNPLGHADPDLGVPPTDRAPGGLGIFLVRQAADDLSYRRDGDRNILTLVLNLTA